MFIMQEGDIGVCGIAVLDNFFVRYFGKFNLINNYCGILQTWGMQFFGIFDSIKNYPSSFPTFSEPCFI